MNSIQERRNLSIFQVIKARIKAIFGHYVERYVSLMFRLLFKGRGDKGIGLRKSLSWLDGQAAFVGSLRIYAV